jgi:luciferase family oxidoreductase group 1
MTDPAAASLRLSVLDQSTVAVGRTEDAAIRDTVALAQHCEALGYSRFWVSEHHNHASIVGTAPEVLLAALAMRTTRIRLGSAGVMLPHYSALHVAEQFRVLDALAPGRIDLGVGRAPGSDGRTAYALNPHSDGGEGFPAQVRDLLHWLHGLALPDGHSFRSVAAHPMNPASAPQLWMLGSSDYGAQLAALFGLPYSFAHFITDGRGADQALALYRRNFKATAFGDAPRASLCVWALAAETEDEARHLFRTRARWRLDRNQGKLGPLLAPDDVPPFSPAEETETEALWQRSYAGSAGQVAQKLRRLAAGMQLDEIVVLTWTHDQEVKRRSYELLAREFNLSATAVAA